MNRFVYIAPLLSLLAVGCAESEPPAIAQLEIASPVVRGELAEGSLVVSDPDGLRGLELSASLALPVAARVPFAEPKFSDAETEATVPFGLLLSADAPVGHYKLLVEATDVDDEVSNEAAVEFDVE